MSMYVIQCEFQTDKDALWVKGLALCSDPDTPETFIYPNGKPYNGTRIWNYNLLHTQPWAKFDLPEGAA